ncbi:MAG TPA: response regulator [Thermoanaerobaculia bacterium]|nr:response regulator [Thermoanaerobaculia bacterium]
MEIIGETATRATLIVDDDERITEALALYIAGPDRTVITCNDIESAQIVLEQMPITEVIADVQYSGRFGFEGLALIRHIRAYAPKARVILMSGRASAELREEATALGAHALLEKPFDPDILESLLSMEED